MALRTLPTAAQDAMAGWWPSRYGAGDEAGALLNVHHGVVVVENLRLADAAHDCLGEFLLVISHAKLRGATGAWVAPLAIV